jgi:hypothetical protein
VNQLIKLTLSEDDDGTGQLFVEAWTENFSGRSSAWFNIADIAEFANQLRAYPLTHEVELRGGYFSPTTNLLGQEHVGLRIFPVGNRGAIHCHVTLATPEGANALAPRQFMSAVLPVAYEELRQFSVRLADLALGKRDEATLHGAVA